MDANELKSHIQRLERCYDHEDAGDDVEFADCIQKEWSKMELTDEDSNNPSDSIRSEDESTAANSSIQLPSSNENQQLNEPSLDSLNDEAVSKAVESAAQRLREQLKKEKEARKRAQEP